VRDDAKKDEKPKEEKPKEDKPKEEKPKEEKAPEPPAPKPVAPTPPPPPPPAPVNTLPPPRDAFDDTLGRNKGFVASVMPGELDRGYDEINDYDREAERADSVRYDDDSWPDYQQPFFEMEQSSMHTPLREKELMGQVSEQALGEEIRHAVEGQAGI